VSDLFDDDPRAAATRRRPAPRRSRALLITAVVVVLAIFGSTGFASIYTDRLWYASAGFGQVFSTMLWTRVGLFVAFGVLMGGVLALNLYLAYRFRPLFRPSSQEQSNLDRYRDVVTPIRTWLLIGTAVVVGAFAGTSGMGHWRTYLLWRNATPFGTSDPKFDRDIGFYVFDLPWLHFVVDFTMATMVIALVGALVVHYLYGGIRLQTKHDRLSGAAQAQISVLLGLFVLAKAADYWLDRFDLVYQQNSLFTGLNYTADNAVLNAKDILLVVALICAVLFFVNVWRRTWQLPSVSLALLAVCAVLLGMIWPAVVQQFQVKPSEADREAPYIQANIDATRAAYQLNDVDTVGDYDPSGTLNASTGGEPVTDQLSTVPLVDPEVIQPAFQNLQQVRSYYTTADVLDVDRYEIDGTQRQLVLGVRELDQSGITDQNWSNLHTVYTHGNGIIAAYANQRDAANDEEVDGAEEDSSANPDNIVWAQGTGAEDDLQQATGGYEPRVYYAEQSPEYSVVGKADPGDEDVELNLQTPGSDDGDSTTFEGDGDASVGSTFNQLMFAIKYGEPNFLLSGRVNDNSKVLFERDPSDRVRKVAPWLTVDSDPYPAVVDGRIQWIIDGYTTTDRYPGSQRESFETMTRDALQDDTGLRTLPTDEINYMRNSVKATVDAYDGTVKLYQWDESDPIVNTWMKAFPGSVEPRSQMPEELMQHVRYPEDLFKVQRYQFARYHVDNASDWYEGNNRWSVPQDPYADDVYQAPYRLFTQNAETGSTDQTFSLTSVFVPFGRNNLASYLSVNSDATSNDYGKLQVLELSTDLTSGPRQVANDFSSDTEIADEVARFQRSGARVTPGNILTFPIDDGLMYVQPLYVSRQTGDASYPTLNQVLVKFGDDIGSGNTLVDALRQIATDVAAPTDGGGGDGGTGQGGTLDEGGGSQGGTDQTTQQQINQLLTQIQNELDAAETARQSGNLGEYQAAVTRATTLIGRVQDLREGAASGGASADAAGADGADGASADASAGSGSDTAAGG